MTTFTEQQGLRDQYDPCFCEHEGCESQDTVECRLFFMVGDQPDTEFHHYCADHAAQEGFCYYCGLFWAGIEAFDFAVERGGIHGLCPECTDELRADSGEDDDDWEEDEPYDEYRDPLAYAADGTPVA